MEIDAARAAQAVRAVDALARNTVPLSTLTTAATASDKPTVQVTGGTQTATLTTVELSKAGALIAAAGRSVDHKGGGLILAASPVAARPDEPRVVARTLERSVSESGLFYEAHLVDWADGRRPLAAIAREPQAQLASSLAAADPDAAGGAPPADTAIAYLSPPASLKDEPQSTSLKNGPQSASPKDAPASLEDGSALLEDQPASLKDGSTSLKDGSTSLQGEPAPLKGEPAPLLLNLVREQLNTLASQHILWRGPLWVEQPGEIEIGRDSPDASANDQIWRARLAVELPQLGTIEVKLALHGSSLTLAMRAGADTTGALLRAEVAPLLISLDSQGLSAHVQVERARDDHDNKKGAHAHSDPLSADPDRLFAHPDRLFAHARPNRSLIRSRLGQRPLRHDSRDRASAVALAYNAGDSAPKVVAKGRGVVAEEIIKRAREAGVFVHESAELVGLLSKVDLDASIPPQLYYAIAEVLAWVYRMEQSAKLESAAPPLSRKSS